MRTKALLLTAVLLLVVAPLARGDQVALRLSSGASIVEIMDDSVGIDLVPGLGIIAWSGMVGTWEINVPTGIMDPSGDPVGSLHLNSVNSSPRPADPLVIEFTRWDIMSTLYQYFRLDISGMISNGTVLYEAYRGAGAFDEAQLIGSIGPLGPVDFSGTAFALMGPSPVTPYSFTQRITIDSKVATTVSFDATLKPVPEPGTGILLGLGALALGTFLRRRFA